MKTRFKLRVQGTKHAGALTYAEDAAALAAIWGEGAKINWQNLVTVWDEGSEAFSAGDSYDAAAQVMHARIDAYKTTLTASDRKTAREAAAKINSQRYMPQ